MAKKIVCLAVVGVGVLATAVLVRAVTPEQSTQRFTPRLETVAIEVQGQGMEMCEWAVSNALKSRDGVTGVSVDRKICRAEVTYDPALVSPQAFVQALGSVGHSASFPEEAARRAPAGAANAPRGHAAPARLTPKQIETVSAFVADHVLKTEEIPSAAQVKDATGVAITIADTPVLQEAVRRRLGKDPRGQKLLAGSRCSDYGACSLWGSLSGNLATATGETLAMYEREKALDGSTYDDLARPAFEAHDWAGEKVRSTDLVGRPAVLAFLAVHCNHSMDTFPILRELHRRYGKRGLQVVGILVNSGSVRDANEWVPQQFAPEHPMWVYETASLGDLIGSHLVPTYLLVDKKGRVRKRIVGFKDQETVLADVRLIQGSSD